MDPRSSPRSPRPGRCSLSTRAASRFSPPPRSDTPVPNTATTRSEPRAAHKALCAQAADTAWQTCTTPLAWGSSAFVRFEALGAQPAVLAARAHPPAAEGRSAVAPLPTPLESPVGPGSLAVALCTAPEARGGAVAGGDAGADVDVYVTEFPFPDRALEARLTFAPAFADAVGAHRMSEVCPPLPPQRLAVSAPRGEEI